MPSEVTKRPFGQNCPDKTGELGNCDVGALIKEMTKDQRLVQSCPTSFNGSNNLEPFLDLKVDPLPEECASEGDEVSDEEGDGDERKKRR